MSTNKETIVTIPDIHSVTPSACKTMLEAYKAASKCDYVVEYNDFGQSEKRKKTEAEKLHEKECIEFYQAKLREYELSNKFYEFDMGDGTVLKYF